MLYHTCPARARPAQAKREYAFEEAHYTQHATVLEIMRRTHTGAPLSMGLTPATCERPPEKNDRARGSPHLEKNDYFQLKLIES